MKLNGIFYAQFCVLVHLRKRVGEIDPTRQISLRAMARSLVMEGDAGCPPLRVGAPAGSEHSG